MGFDAEKEISEIPVDSQILMIPFNNTFMKSTSIVKAYSQEGHNVVRVFCKGAPDLLIGKCTNYLNSEGQEQNL